MRKFTFLISLLLLLSLLLVACGGAEESNEGTAALETPETGFETQTSPGLETQALETPPVTLEPTAMATTAPTEEASPTIEPTELPATPGPILPGTGSIDPSRLSNLLGLDVRNSGGDNLGNAQDFVIDLGKSQVNYMILASGGILGIGEKLVPVPWDAVRIDPDCGVTNGTGGTGGSGSTGATGTLATGTPASGGTPAAGGTAGTNATGTPASGGTTGTMTNLQGGCFIMLDVDQQTIENAPNVDLSALPDVTVENWDQEFLNYWNSMDLGTGGNQLVTSTPAAGGMAGTSTPAAGGGTGTGTGTGTPAAGGGTGTPAPGTGTMTISQLNGMILASDLLGLNLVSRNGDQLGEVEDAIVDLETGAIRYLLISADASLNIAGNWVPVPLSVLGRGSDNGLVLDTGDDAMNVLVNAPNFDANSMPDTHSSNWDSDISSYWNTITP